MDSLFYIFVLHLTLMIILFTVMCVANMVIHADEVKDDPKNADLNGGDVFYLVLSRYWISMVGAFIAVLVSLASKCFILLSVG